VTKALSTLGLGRGLSVGKPSLLLFSVKAGPNSPIATLGIGFDLLGWMARPNKYWLYCLMC
jgi:hypothetical protein